MSLVLLLKVDLRSLIIFLIVIISCSPEIKSTRTSFNTSIIVESPSPSSSAYLKVHMKNGKLAVINSWLIDNDKKAIVGDGKIYNAHRQVIYDGKGYRFNFDDIIMLETNEYDGYNVISPLLMTLTIFTSVVSIPCLANPKSCFGSCPTYYLHQDDSLIIQAEGFSSSITKSMEAIDVDHLTGYKQTSDNTLKLELRNEALETHYIRKSEILAVSKPNNSNIYFGEGQFYSTSQLSSPIKVNDSDETLLELLSKQDRVEYWSKSDSTDLTSKESLVLEFDSFNGLEAGIVITQRQSLMTTFLFYQSLAYMGTRLGEIMVAYEKASPLVRNAQKSMYEILGGVEVSIMIKSKWKKVGFINEQGPITTDTHLIPVNYPGTFRKVKLTMTKGLWRIDQVALTDILDVHEPLVIQPSRLLNGDKDEKELLETLIDPDNMLVNNPGTSYTLVYELPEVSGLALFLRSQGYYTEWMRSQWLKEENQSMVNMIIKRPKKWLVTMSPKYKQAETEMDSLFWSSKFGRGAY